MLDPDLSTTLPEKLPVAWPYIAGETASARAHAATRRDIRCSVLLARPSEGFEHSALIIVRFIVKPLSITSTKGGSCMNSRNERLYFFRLNAKALNSTPAADWRICPESRLRPYQGEFSRSNVLVQTRPFMDPFCQFSRFSMGESDQRTCLAVVAVWSDPSPLECPLSGKIQGKSIPSGTISRI